MSFSHHLALNDPSEMDILLEQYLHCCVSYQLDNWTKLWSFAEFQ